MKILIANLPISIPTVMPYSTAMMHSILKSSLQVKVDAIDLNSKFHYEYYKEFFKNKEKDYYNVLQEFLKQTRIKNKEMTNEILKTNKSEYSNFLIQHILDKKPDIVLFSLIYNSQVFFAKIITEELIKKNIKVIIGGPADYSKIMAIKLNNYLELINYLKDLGCKEKNDIPILDYSLFNKKEYITNEIIYPIRTSDSCPYKKCTFCTHHANKNYQEYDLSFLESAIIKNKMKKICFVDDDLTISRLLKIAKILKKYDIKWWCQLRPIKNLIKILPTLYESGLRSVAWGVESGCERILNLMQKGTNIKDISSVLKKSNELGIKNMAYILFGFPTENKMEFLETLDFLKDNNESIDLISTSIFGLQKQSKVFLEPNKYHINNIQMKDRTFLGSRITYQQSQGLDTNKIKTLKRKYAKTLNNINKLPKILSLCKEQILNIDS